MPYEYFQGQPGMPADLLFVLSIGSQLVLCIKMKTRDTRVFWLLKTNWTTGTK